MLSNAIQRSWYDPNILTWFLLPLSYVYRCLVWLRNKACKVGIFRTYHLCVPIIVVGNITVGGTGKTPLVIWLCEYLKKTGWKPGVIGRGYRGQSESWPQVVTDKSNPNLVGDEAVLVARRTQCPVCVGPRRVAAAQRLLDEYPCNIIISDDGLQHLALERDIEIAVIDGERRFGNGYCLPAGPLRESIERLNNVDLKVTNGVAQDEEFGMDLVMLDPVNLQDESMRKSFTEFGSTPVHAVSGIGHPQRFFKQLDEAGLNIIAHSFPDHHTYVLDDLRFNDDHPVLMTEKDTVKCKAFASKEHWYVPVNAKLDERFEKEIEQRLAGFKPVNNS